MVADAASATTTASRWSTPSRRASRWRSASSTRSPRRSSARSSAWPSRASTASSGLSYRLLGLISFFTAGPDETRAWTIHDGDTAVDAAGVIHSDLARGFIRAEVVACEDLLELGSMAEARRHGRLRQEGKTYRVKDGDVLEVLFNV